MSMTIQSSVKDKILATPSETSKVENAPAEMLRDLDQQMEKRADDGCTLWIKLYSKYEYEIRYHPGKANVTDQVSSFSSYTRRFQDVKLAKIYIDEIIASNGILVEIGESSLTGLELVQETSDKFKVGDRVLLKVSPWKGVIRFGKKGKLAPRYVGPFKILERISPVAYRLRLLEELSGVHDTFHVSNLKKCLAYASLHVPLDEIKVEKTFRFVEEPVEIMDREVKSLKRSSNFACKSLLEF
ncbi:hypothetical protein Tco_0185558 [Tanacetum coccineum]